METTSAFLLVGAIIALAAFLGAWAAFLKQPIFIAYIIAGIIAGPLILHSNVQAETLNLLADLGLSFVLFLVGMDLKTKDLRRFGLAAVSVGLKQIAACLIVALLVARLLGFSNLASVYIAVALAFSSTMVTVKILTEKRELDSLFGELTVSILLLQDLVAIFALIIISSFATSGGASAFGLLITVVVGAFLLGLGYVLNQTLLPYVFERIAYNTELLFIGALAWLFIIAAGAAYAGFSLEIGAFLAGVGLANLPEEQQIAARIRPLRDFFILIFFILIGARVALSQLSAILLPAFVLTVLVLILKPLVTMFWLSRAGFRKRTAFMSGLAISQVSEFSLVLLFFGQKIGHINQNTVGTVTLVTLATIAASSYGLQNANRLYRWLGKYLDIFEPKTKITEEKREKEFAEHFVLIGAGRLGWDILKGLARHEKDIVVVEFNPAISDKLREENFNIIFGDITDPEIQEEANLEQASLVISTIFDEADTQELLETIKSYEREIPFVATAATEFAGLKFYQQGATYVIIPRVISSRFFANLLSPQKLEELMDGDFRSSQIEELSSRLKTRL